ncbi:DUF1800 family protein [Sphingosinithalassobacter sp. CS137]|uniref:DUF1800 domain-containing protein n=1 Tax=Sphingosinithalassobacter sp. CS137 TaxID=2762748 RepID=UPI00165D90F9|nr:DUF1800 domain-containing protein [Sphingosinithalassobacter sp. CS137]
MSDVSIALNRFGLGGRAGDAPPQAPKRWLLDQFGAFEARPVALAQLPSTAAIAADLAHYLTDVRMQRREMRRAAPETMADPDPDAAPMRDPAQQARAFARRQGREVYSAAVGARAAAALDTPAPFVERLVHFWANHFAVSADKLTVTGLVGAFEFDAIRPHVLGRFADMLQAVERHPAMLLYLDQAQSVGPDSVAGKLVRRRRPDRALGLNENLAREILELHTLGVRTGYDQNDVTEFARALTGWTVAGLGNGPGARLAGVGDAPGSFVFAERLHEPGTRTILGRAYAQEAGEGQAAAVLDSLALHPATARHVATKLARHFAGDEPPASLVAKLEAAFLRTGGDLPSLYRVLVEAPECWVAAPVKFRTPWEWSLAAFRALGTREVPTQGVTNLVNQLGQPIWRPGSPAGYDDIAASWAGPDALMRRVEAAERMAQRTRNLVDARARAAELFPDALSEGTAQAIARAESPGQGLALLLVAPEFLRR